MDFDGGTHKITVASGVVTATGFSGTVVIYVNGKISSTLAANTWSHVAITTTTSFTGSAVKIGYDNSTYFNGFMDDVKIYPYARTAAQIKTDYNSRGSVKGAATNLGNIKTNVGIGNSAPVGYWNFEERTGSSANDTSGNGYSGTITGATYQTGKYGKALNFNGSTDAVGSISSVSSINTVSFWVNPSSTTANLIDVQTTPGTINISASSDTISATGFSTPTIYVNGISGSTATGGAWNHIVITTATSFNTTSSMTFGYKSAATADFLNGQIDDARIYNYALTAAQVKDVMNQGAVFFEPSTGSP